MVFDVEEHEDAQKRYRKTPLDAEEEAAKAGPKSARNVSPWEMPIAERSGLTRLLVGRISDELSEEVGRAIEARPSSRLGRKGTFLNFAEAWALQGNCWPGPEATQSARSTAKPRNILIRALSRFAFPEEDATCKYRRRSCGARLV
jgi:hypothetical protein